MKTNYPIKSIIVPYLQFGKMEDTVKKITENLMIPVVFFIHITYNKNVIVIHINPNKSVKGCIYGTTDFAKTAGLEKLSLPQAADPERGAAGRQDLGSQGIRQTLL